ncbi:MAG: YebC/PmpR family DNA-binding transcriptional regulator [Acidobacteria bacterium]|nr:YebC/PmpR family DNA-binding transcriptional regulator [Acidobacteriota bacterium]
MAGHSKWANIQHRKGKVDAQRGKIFTKLVREITVSAKAGGPDPDGNPRLRAAITAAKAQSMPNDNIKRAIEKATGSGDGANYEEMVYEGYGPSGVALMVAAVTDNKNRTTPEIRHAFSKCGGNMAESGAVSWQFTKKGYITVDKGDRDEEQLTELLIEAGGDDFEDLGDKWGIITEPDALHAVAGTLEELGLPNESATFTMIPSTEITVTGDDLKRVIKLVEMLEDNDDVQNVWNNADFDESELE